MNFKFVTFSDRFHGARTTSSSEWIHHMEQNVGLPEGIHDSSVSVVTGCKHTQTNRHILIFMAVSGVIRKLLVTFC